MGGWRVEVVKCKFFFFSFFTIATGFVFIYLLFLIRKSRDLCHDVLLRRFCRFNKNPKIQIPTLCTITKSYT